MDPVHPEILHILQKEDTAKVDFDTYFKRPKNFFNLTESEQWEIDKHLGLLDAPYERLKGERLARWIEHFELPNN